MVAFFLINLIQHLRGRGKLFCMSSRPVWHTKLCVIHSHIERPGSNKQQIIAFCMLCAYEYPWRPEQGVPRELVLKADRDSYDVGVGTELCKVIKVP